MLIIELLSIVILFTISCFIDSIDSYKGDKDILYRTLQRSSYRDR